MSGGENGHAFEHADELEREVAGLRNRLGALITELGRRRREAFDVRLQARRHPVSAVLGTAVVLGLVGLGIAAVVHRRRQARSLQGRISGLGAGKGPRMVEDRRPHVKRSPTTARASRD